MPLKLALKSIGLMLLIACAALAAVVAMFGGLGSHADADPNHVLARAVTPYLRDGQVFRLADAYPTPWDAVQLVQGGDTLTPWVWRALRAFDPTLAQPRQDAQLLVFWRDGEIAQMVRFERTGGMPWFVLDAAAAETATLPRGNAIFMATLTEAEPNLYYTCEPVAAGTEL